MLLTDQELLEYNCRGLIPGPQESEEDFVKRLAKIETISVDAPALSQADWEEAYTVVEPLYGFKPDWITAYYSNRELPFWQAAATWIEDAIPHIQLKTPFQKGSYYKLYTRGEVLAHEAVHAARTAFHEPQFEEVLAYATSKSAIHRWLGPLFKRSWESYVFIALLPLFATPLFSLPLMASALGGLRLVHTHWLLYRCYNNIKKMTQHPRALLFRLTDKEILQFGCASEEEIRCYFSNNASLRLRVLHLAYINIP